MFEGQSPNSILHCNGVKHAFDEMLRGLVHSESLVYFRSWTDWWRQSFDLEYISYPRSIKNVYLLFVYIQKEPSVRYIFLSGNDSTVWVSYIKKSKIFESDHEQSKCNTDKLGVIRMLTSAKLATI